MNESSQDLEKYSVIASDRKYNFCQRDPLALCIRSRAIASQKIDYMHNNPLQLHWQLSNSPGEYRFSSASFYESGYDEFGILKHFMDVF